MRLVCRGAVQGVGFRPSVHRLATSLGLTGWVRNDPAGAVIEVQGAPAVVECFRRRLPGELPSLARLDGLEMTAIEPSASTGFEIALSDLGRRAGALLPPDAALCPECRAEMDDPRDRRHRYPFTTCTHCGPRLSIARDLPYDRERTSMACFPLCPDCLREYTDPNDRRFHAEPVCCGRCGPHLALLDASGIPVAKDTAALEQARSALDAGRIVAVKGLGGFQLACRADRREPLCALRERKGRATKPFAVMARSLDVARRLAHLDAEGEALLTSPRAPIVLAPRRAGIVEEVAPGLRDIGIMLPTTPLHVELFRGLVADALVMTSGNAGDEPICRGNREAVRRLSGITDLLLVHDRDVVRRVDDSVVRLDSGEPILVRRSRGYVPEPLPVPEMLPRPVLALGGHLQTTACVAAGEQAFPSQHVGDLDHEDTRDFLAEVASGLEQFLQVRSMVIAVDLHPDHASTWLGERICAERGARLVRVQHHLAHAAAVLAEHGAFPRPGERAGAIVLDGTGWGPDGTAWGGEWLEIDGSLRWARHGSIRPLPLVGGERAVLEPWRVAAAALASHGESDLVARLPMTAALDPEMLAGVIELSRRPSWPLASGAGRLFEAAGALLGLTTRNEWEGEAAARLESLASTAGAVEPWPEVKLADRAPLLPGAGLITAAARRAVAGEPPASIAAGFHATFVRLAIDLARLVFPEGTPVALGGGCLVNRILRAGLREGLERAGRRPLLARAVPSGDGGLSYGQAVLAGLAVARSSEPRQVQPTCA